MVVEIEYWLKSRWICDRERIGTWQGESEASPKILTPFTHVCYKWLDLWFWTDFWILGGEGGGVFHPPSYLDCSGLYLGLSAFYVQYYDIFVIGHWQLSTRTRECSSLLSLHSSSPKKAVASYQARCVLLLLQGQGFPAHILTGGIQPIKICRSHYGLWSWGNFEEASTLCWSSSSSSSSSHCSAAGVW